MVEPTHITLTPPRVPTQGMMCLTSWCRLAFTKHKLARHGSIQACPPVELEDPLPEAAAAAAAELWPLAAAAAAAAAEPLPADITP